MENPYRWPYDFMKESSLNALLTRCESEFDTLNKILDAEPTTLARRTQEAISYLRTLPSGVLEKAERRYELDWAERQLEYDDNDWQELKEGNEFLDRCGIKRDESFEKLVEGVELTLVEMKTGEECEGEGFCGLCYGSTGWHLRKLAAFAFEVQHESR